MPEKVEARVDLGDVARFLDEKRVYQRGPEKADKLISKKFRCSEKKAGEMLKELFATKRIKTENKHCQIAKVQCLHFVRMEDGPMALVHG
jgi:hypothetical protein